MVKATEKIVSKGLETFSPLPSIRQTKLIFTENEVDALLPSQNIQYFSNLSSLYFLSLSVSHSHIAVHQ
jgi:hypothetical protein